MKFSTEPALYLFLATVFWAFLTIFFEMNNFIFLGTEPCKELYMLSFDCDPSNMTTLVVELSLGLVAAIILALYFRKKERREKEQRKREGLKQICDRFIHTLEHVTGVDDKVRQYYGIIQSQGPSNNPANVSYTKKQCEDRIQGLRSSIGALENSLLLVAGDLDHSVKSGMRFFVDVVERDTVLFENQFADFEKLSGLIGTANATKERLKKYAPDLIENAELELEDLKNKIKQGKNVSNEIMDFVWKEQSDI